VGKVEKRGPSCFFRRGLEELKGKSGGCGDELTFERVGRVKPPTALTRKWNGLKLTN